MERSIRSVANLTRQDAEEFFPIAAAARDPRRRPRPSRLADAESALARLRVGGVDGALVLTPSSADSGPGQFVVDSRPGAGNNRRPLFVGGGWQCCLVFVESVSSDSCRPSWRSPRCCPHSRRGNAAAVKRMHDHLTTLDTVQYAVVRGDLDDAKAASADADRPVVHGRPAA